MPRSLITTQFAFEEHNDTVLQRVNRSVSEFSGFVFSPTGAIAGAAALGAGLAKLTSQYLENARAVNRVAASTRTSTEAVSALNFAFGRFGYDINDVDSILAELEIKTYDWRDGVSGVSSAFRELNLDLSEFEGLAPDEKLRQVTRALADVESGSRRLGIADVIFGGDDARKILAIADDLDHLTETAVRTGNTIDEASAMAAERTARNMDTIQAVIEGAGNRIGAAIVNWGGPILEGLGKSVGILPDETRETMEDIERQLLSRVAQASAAGLSYAQALTDPITNELAQKAIEIDVFARSYEQILARANAREAYRAFTSSTDVDTEEYLNAFIPGRRENLARGDRLAEARRIRNLGEGADNPYLPGQYGQQNPLGYPASRLATSIAGLPPFARADSRVSALIASQGSLDVDPFNAFLNKESATIQTEAIRANQIIFDASGDGGVGGFGGGGRIDGQGLIDASKNDPVRVTVAGIGGLNEGAGRNQRFREIRIDENELINRDGLVNLILAVLQDYTI